MQTERGNGTSLPLTDKLRLSKAKLLFCFAFGAVCTVVMMSKQSQEVRDESLASKIFNFRNAYMSVCKITGEGFVV